MSARFSLTSRVVTRNCPRSTLEYSTAEFARPLLSQPYGNSAVCTRRTLLEVDAVRKPKRQAENPLVFLPALVPTAYVALSNILTASSVLNDARPHSPDPGYREY